MKQRILIVDDEANIRNSLTAVLTDEGYECLPAKDGQEALQLVETEELQLIITDLVMPNLDGLELLREVRKNHEDIRVIMLTAYGTVESAVQALKFGAVDFLLKPVDFEMLLLKVQEVFREVALRREVEQMKQQCQAGTCDGVPEAHEGLGDLCGGDDAPHSGVKRR